MRTSRLTLPLLLLALACSGCGRRVHGGPGEPVRREAEPVLGAGERRILEAREQSALSPDEPYWPYRLAQVLIEADSVAEARAALVASLRRDPGYMPSLSLLSKLHYDAGQHAEGAALLEAARTRASAPDGLAPELLAALALHYQALGRPDLARPLVESSRDDAGRTGPARVYLALRGENPAAATPLATRAVEEDSLSAVNQNNYGITRLRAGDPRAARDAFLRAIDLDPDLPGPYYNLAILERFYLFDERAAARWLAAYRERASDDPDGLFGTPGSAEAPVARKGGAR